MLDLLEKYSVSEILIFIALLFVAIKEVIEGIEWIKQKYQEKHQETSQEEKQKESVVDMKKTLKELTSTVKTLNDNFKVIEPKVTHLDEAVKTIESKVDLLTASDKDDIKAWITERHHHFCYDQKWIDDYSLDTISRRYEHYKDEGGNSFIAELMSELQALPKQPIK